MFKWLLQLLAGPPPADPPPAPPAPAVSLETFLSDLQRLASRQLPEQLPEEYYAPVLASLAACFSEFQFKGDEYKKYLTASVESVVAFTKETLAVIPKTDSPFTVDLATFIGDKGDVKILKALATPFSPLSSYFSHSSENSNDYDASYFISANDWKYDRESAEKRAKDNKKWTDDYINEFGYYFWLTGKALSRTPYERHFHNVIQIIGFPVPYPLNEEARFQHTWICSPTGTGKTTLLENLIVHDLNKVLDDEATIIVIDSQNELIPRLTSIVPPELDRLVLLEPDLEHPLALNLFDSQAIDYSSSLELADFVMTSLLGADLTSKQAGMHRHCTSLVPLHFWQLPLCRKHGT